MKNVLKTTKGKVVAGVVTVGLVSGLGVATASTDIGGKLQTWYDGQFGAAQSDMIDDAANHVKGKAAGVIAQYKNGKDATANAINDTRDSSIEGAEDTIGDAKDKYISDLEEHQATIEEDIEAQFDGLFDTAQILINDAGDRVYAFAKDDFTELAGDTGTAALDEVETQINGAKGNAVLELEEAIADAKEELQSELDNQESATTEEIKNAIDAKISELRGKMASFVSDLISEQKGLITDKAEELEENAIAALDDAANF